MERKRLWKTGIIGKTTIHTQEKKPRLRIVGQKQAGPSQQMMRKLQTLPTAQPATWSHTEHVAVTSHWSRMKPTMPQDCSHELETSADKPIKYSAWCGRKMWTIKLTSCCLQLRTHAGSRRHQKVKNTVKNTSRMTLQHTIYKLQWIRMTGRKKTIHATSRDKEWPMWNDDWIPVNKNSTPEGEVH